MTDRLGMEYICALGMAPDRYVDLAASLGLGRIGLGGGPITANPYGFAPWNLAEDAALRKATGAAMRAGGVSLALGEGFLIMQGLDVDNSKPLADAHAELGAPLINCVVIEQDRARATGQFCQLAAIAAERDMLLSIEFMPMMWPVTLDEAREFVVASGAANARLLVDAMHFYRSGAATGDLARIDPDLIGYIQICDVPMPATDPDYGMEARDNRQPIGAGDLPLAGFLAALPRGVTVGIEAPMAARAATGLSPEDLLRPSVEAARRLLAELE